LQPMKLVIADASRDFITVANRHPDPRRVDIAAHGAEVADLLPQGPAFDTTKSGAWLCVGQTCLPPIGRSDELERHLTEPRHLSGSGVNGVEAVGVVLCPAELVDEELDRVRGAHRRQDEAQDEDLMQILPRNEEILLAGAGFE